MVESLLFIGAGAGENNTKSRSKTDRLRNTDRMYSPFWLLVLTWIKRLPILVQFYFGLRAPLLGLLGFRLFLLPANQSILNIATYGCT